MDSAKAPCIEGIGWVGTCSLIVSSFGNSRGISHGIRHIVVGSLSYGCQPSPNTSGSRMIGRPTSCWKRRQFVGCGTAAECTYAKNRVGTVALHRLSRWHWLWLMIASASCGLWARIDKERYSKETAPTGLAVSRPASDSTLARLGAAQSSTVHRLPRSRWRRSS